MLVDLEKDLKHWRLVVRRHKSFLALLNMKPESFLTTNGRDIIRQAMMDAIGECVKLETAIIELQKSSGRTPRKRSVTHGRV